MALANSHKFDGTGPILHLSGGRVTGAGQPEGSVPFGAKCPPEGQKMELRFLMKYVACEAQPDAGKSLEMQVTLLPLLEFVDEVLPLSC